MQSIITFFKKGGILLAVILAIVLALICGQFFPVPLVRAFATFNAVFSQFLGFCIPLIIIGLVTPAIADLGSGSAKWLGITALIAYASTLYSGFLTYGVSMAALPTFLHQGGLANIEDPSKSNLASYFTIEMPAPISVMGALILSFILGIGLSMVSRGVLRRGFVEFRAIIIKLIEKVIIPLLPIHIFGIFLNMTESGAVGQVIIVLLTVVILVLVLEVVILLTQYLVGALAYGVNPFKALWTMLPAYLTALGTSSSAATIPVTLKQVKKLGVPDAVASFTVPLCATIHLAGSTSKITAFALAIMITSGIPIDPIQFMGFIFMLGVTMVAAPGVPGGAIMAATGILASMLGFNDSQVALMIASYIALDSFGTATNVTGDGAISLIMARLSGGKFSERDQKIASSFASESSFDSEAYLADVK
ncbi:MAG: dicarboxylate/amino acid:cation symporter [Mobiluncus porci]|uniref:Dicarboxylate/amino acid:cation symporter n=1 Tax=Mobiluncus porci TaxID=2652278 RepID=A0A7K0K4H1_9ACTO|nr:MULTISPECIES: dicarboxylate/amino acid:cation symporter [Mobiluncus]MCI6584391.1 dicarboxylate/amino acid:cation symporter [Mobiluncus sp.]MDD7541811.1 dicarboxylate/amino acid:cation symporter [Mobiluncus porci]MDY5748659.1 dicarboxylate/amino acid:cation symporter [Mobiluncus porci]MST50334.1 dicarboxylate/amino acid:cation symporter [Mobiluncus porci]